MAAGVALAFHLRQALFDGVQNIGLAGAFGESLGRAIRHDNALHGHVLVSLCLRKGMLFADGYFEPGCVRGLSGMRTTILALSPSSARKLAWISCHKGSH